MWRTDTLWFDVAVVMSIFAVGDVLFGRFEEHRPRGRRLLKAARFLGAVLPLSATAGRGRTACWRCRSRASCGCTASGFRVTASAAGPPSRGRATWS